MSDTSETEYGSDGLNGWDAVGIPPVEAHAWSSAGYQPNEVRDWRGAGALDPGTAADWERSGFTPSTAEPWIVISEIGPADAIAMSDAGMTPADCLRIRASDLGCVSAATDASGRQRIEEQTSTIGF